MASWTSVVVDTPWRAEVLRGKDPALAAKRAFAPRPRVARPAEPSAVAAVLCCDGGGSWRGLASVVPFAGEVRRGDEKRLGKRSPDCRQGRSKL